MVGFRQDRRRPKVWHRFISINSFVNEDFRRRAGVSPDSPFFEALVSALFNSPAISVHGFYGHAGNAYASTSLSEASSFLSSEVDAVNTAARTALDLLTSAANIEAHTQPFVLSVGSTPTAHAASAETRALLSQALHGTLELHAGM